MIQRLIVRIAERIARRQHLVDTLQRELDDDELMAAWHKHIRELRAEREATDRISRNVQLEADMHEQRRRADD